MYIAVQVQYSVSFVFCPVALSALGGCLVKKGETDEAEKLLKESLEMRRTSVPDDKANFAFSESFCLTVNRRLINIPVARVEQLLQCVPTLLSQSSSFHQLF